MGMASSELVNLIKNCPKGAETLVIRVVQVLTQCSNIHRNLSLSCVYFFIY